MGEDPDPQLCHPFWFLLTGDAQALGKQPFPPLQIAGVEGTRGETPNSESREDIGHSPSYAPAAPEDLLAAWVIFSCWKTHSYGDIHRFNLRQSTKITKSNHNIRRQQPGRSLQLGQIDDGITVLTRIKVSFYFCLIPVFTHANSNCFAG